MLGNFVLINRQSLILSAFYSNSADGALVLGPAGPSPWFAFVSPPCSLWRMCWEMSHISGSDESAVKCLFLFSLLAQHSSKAATRSVRKCEGHNGIVKKLLRRCGPFSTTPGLCLHRRCTPDLACLSGGRLLRCVATARFGWMFPAMPEPF